MLNRNAEALYWVGRYIERVENHARMIDVHYHIQHERDLEHEAHKWARIVDALGARADYSQQFDSFIQKDVLSFITLDRGYANSVFSCVSQARSNLRTLREKLPSELWEVMNGFYLWLGEKNVDDILNDSPHPFFKQIKDWTAKFYGVQQSVMLRENEWHFIEIGRSLERAENTVRIVRSVLEAIRQDEAPAYPYLLAVLKSVSGYQAFRKFYADAVSVEHIMEFLIGSTTFPRSVHFAFSRITDHLCSIELPNSGLHVPQDRIIKRTRKVIANLACLEREDMSIPGVQAVLDGLNTSCQTIGKTMNSAFFQFEGAAV